MLGADSPKRQNKWRMRRRQPRRTAGVLDPRAAARGVPSPDAGFGAVAGVSGHDDEPAVDPTFNEGGAGSSDGVPSRRRGLRRRSSQWKRTRLAVRATRKLATQRAGGPDNASHERDREQGRVCELLVHEATEYNDSVVVNPAHFPYVRPGDILHIAPAPTPDAAGKRSSNSGGDTHVRGGGGSVGVGAGAGAGSGANLLPSDEAVSAMFTTTGVLRTLKSVDPVSGTWAISLLRSIADAFGLRRQTVVVRVVKPELVELDFVEVAFRDQFMSRAGMWRFKQAAVGLCAHTGEYVTRAGVRLQFKKLRCAGVQVQSGLMSPRTKFIFRSRSARVTILVQMSREMWEFAEDGQLHFERVVDRFFKVLFDKWTALGVTHNVTIIFFARTHYMDGPSVGGRRHSTNGSAGRGVAAQDGWPQRHLARGCRCSLIGALSVRAGRCAPIGVVGCTRMCTRWWRMACHQTGPSFWFVLLVLPGGDAGRWLTA